MPKFLIPVNAYGEFTVEAEDMYAADELVRNWGRADILDAVDNGRGWLAVETCPNELPSEV